jgi:hypothetical protein
MEDEITRKQGSVNRAAIRVMILSAKALFV